MSVPTSTAMLVSFVLLSHVCSAEEPVLGPPTLITDAGINSDAFFPGGPRLVGTILNWSETEQNWNQVHTFPRGPRSETRYDTSSRKVLVLQAEQFKASLNSLKFSRPNGDTVEASDVPRLLEEKRAIAFVEKGCAIHPAIAKTLHPETLIVTRVSYATDPVVIPLPETR